MSAFLGPIHHWLYDKIILGDSIQLKIIERVQKEGKSTEILEQKAYEKYGKPDASPLEDVIDETNIHGWLHERIGQMEGRLAYLVKELTTNDGISLDTIEAVYEEAGYTAALAYKKQFKMPKEVYQFIFDHLVEGMPCDRVNQVILDIPEKIVWQTTQCVHESYWLAESADVGQYYVLKEAWIQGTMRALESFVYEKQDLNRVIRRK